MVRDLKRRIEKALPQGVYLLSSEIQESTNLSMYCESIDTQTNSFTFHPFTQVWDVKSGR